MKVIRGNGRLWRIAEWFAVSAALSWLFAWTWVVTRRQTPGAPA
jgi:hypothetical protein